MKWQQLWDAEAESLGILDRIEFWGNKVAFSRSPSSSGSHATGTTS